MSTASKWFSKHFYSSFCIHHLRWWRATWLGNLINMSRIFSTHIYVPSSTPAHYYAFTMHFKTLLILVTISPPVCHVDATWHYHVTSLPRGYHVVLSRHHFTTWVPRGVFAGIVLLTFFVRSWLHWTHRPETSVFFHVFYLIESWWKPSQQQN